MTNPLDKSPGLDKENAFLLYAVFCGDVARTAHALDIDPELVRKLAHENKWDTKLKPIIDLKASTRPGDIERAVNRALNFVQAHRYRLFLQTILKKMSDLTEDELDDYIFGETVDKAGTVKHTLTTKGMADMATALEKCHAMTYLALNDTASDRKERDEGADEGASAAEMHIRLAEAMSTAGAKGSSVKALVLDAQLKIAAEVSKTKPDNLK